MSRTARLPVIASGGWSGNKKRDDVHVLVTASVTGRVTAGVRVTIPRTVAPFRRRTASIPTNNVMECASAEVV